MDASASANLFITKFAAAARQLNAAIRMSLTGEDELAVHTVAAAAFRLIRDIKQSRGRNTLNEMYAHALVSLAEDVSAGKSLPPDIAIDTALVGMIEGIAQAINKGAAPSVPDVAKRISLSSERNYWNTFSSTANFLKHADRDFDAIHSIDDIEKQNNELLLFACASYIDTIGRSTPEMHAFAIYACGSDPDFTAPFWSGEHSERFRKASPARRRLLCRRLLKMLKKDSYFRANV